jgi:hypothetical protein
MLAVAENIPTIASVSITQNPRSPVAGWYVRNGNVTVAVTVPPIQLHYIAKSKIRNEIEHVFRHDDGRRRAAEPFCVLHQGPERRPVQMIEVRVRDQNQVDRRQVLNLHPRLTQSFQHKQPAREVRVDQNIFPANLQKKTRMTDKGHAHLTI